MKASLLINTCRQAESLAKVLDSLESQAHLLNEIIVSEDGDDAATAEVMDRIGSRLPTRVHHVWWPWDGFRLAEVRNRGLRLVTGDYVIQIDGDCVAHPRLVRDHVAIARPGRFLQGHRACIAESAVPGFDHRFLTRWRYFLDGRMTGRKVGFRFAPKLDFNREFACALGCNMGFLMDDLRKVNGYDLDMMGWGGEDYDIAGRLGLVGVKPLVMDRAGIVYHLDHPRLSKAGATKNYASVDAKLAAGTFRSTRGLAETSPAHVRHIR